MSSVRRIRCENCFTPYAINVTTLKKEKNTVTCRKCKHKMIVYKSGFVEPKNEAARVTQDDEKTLIDEAPNVQQEMPALETAVSQNPPPYSFPRQETEDSDTFDRTARPEAFAALNQGPSIGISPAQANVAPPKPVQKSEPKQKTAVAAGLPSGFQSVLYLVAGMMTISILAGFGQYYFETGMPAKISLILNVSSLMLGIFLLATSSFGAFPSKMGLSAGLSGVLTIVLGVGVFGFDQAVDTEAAEEKKFIPPEDIVMQENGQEEKVEEEQTAAQQTNRKNRVQTAQMTTRKPANKEDINEAMNIIKSAPKSDIRNDSVADNTRIEPRDIEPIADVPTEPIEDLSGLDDEIDLPPLDMDLDAEEDKKGFFNRSKEKEEVEEIAPKAVSNDEIPKVEIPQSVMDIIIRNNKQVKGCYVDHRRQYNELPKNVKVMFTLQPNGKVSQAYISDGPYVGSTFEACLRSAFKSMTFPSFDSRAKPQSLYYTLKI